MSWDKIRRTHFQQVYTSDLQKVSALLYFRGKR